MTFALGKKVRRRRHLVIWDRRGLPARQISAQHAGRRFDQLLYWAKQNGQCVITEAGRPACVLLSVKAYSELIWRVFATSIVAAERLRNPGGIFTLADEVFRSAYMTDLWMVSRLRSSGEGGPGNMLTPEEVEEIQSILHKTQHGFGA